MRYTVSFKQPGCLSDGLAANAFMSCGSSK